MRRRAKVAAGCRLKAGSRDVALSLAGSGQPIFLGVMPQGGAP